MRTALLIDDNLMFAMPVEAGLRRLGFAARTLPGSPAVVEQVAAAPPALLLVNLASRGSGVELVRALRARPELAETRLLAFTNHTDTATFHAAKEAGADQVVANSAVTAHLEPILRAAGWL